MDASKPYISVGFMEFTFELEKKKFENLLKRKAARIQYLNSEENFNKCSKDNIGKTTELIGKLREELNVLYGFWIFATSMQNTYECQLEKMAITHDFDLKHSLKEIKRLTLDNEVLQYLYSQSIETEQFLSDDTMKMKGNGGN
jgi:hypothetical protein